MTMADAKMAICANPNCYAEPSNGPRCGACSSYLTFTGQERPRLLVLYPNRGHNLLGSTELGKVAGLTYRQIDHAIRTGRVTPTIEAEGTGTRRGFDLDAATTLAVFLALPVSFRDEPIDPRADAIVVEGDHWTFRFDVRAVREHLQSMWPENRDLFLTDGAVAA